MGPRQRSSWRGRLGCGVAAAVLACTPLALAASPGFTVQEQTHVPKLRAFARVQPVADASVRAGMDGRLQRLDVVPGSRVRAGQRIGMIGGSQVHARLASDQARLAAASSEARSLGDALAIQRKRLSQHLSTRADVDLAMGNLARARARLVSTRQTLDADRALASLRAPANGAVIAVRAHVGERVRQGQALLLMQPDDALWLVASAYAPGMRARLQVGMRGKFLPDDGSAAIAIRVAQLPPRLQADGGQPIAMLRDGKDADPAWIDGETGTVVLDGRAEQRLLVPTRALVLDGGQWWVLLATAHGDRRQQVTPGARVGDRTVIRRGLHPGQQVVVDHVYRRFHSSITRHYRIQD